MSRHRTGRAVVCVAVAFTAFLGLGGPVAGIGNWMSDPTVEVGPDGVGGGFGVSDPGLDDDGKPPAQLKFGVINWDDCALGSVPNGDGTFTTTWGRYYLIVLIDADADGAADENQQVVDGTCSPDPPPPPPPPPAPAEVWDFVPLAESKIGVSPGGDGLTGLATLLWYDGPVRPVTLGPLELRGYTLTATVRPVSYRWRMGDDPDPTRETTYRTRTPGSAEGPAVSHVYERKGDYTLRMEVLWQGTYTFTGFGVTTERALGGVTVVRTRPYHVAEARSVRP